MDRFEELEVKIFDRFIDKFAERYVQQRSAVPLSVLAQAAALDCGLDTEALMRIIRSTSCYVDSEREAGRTPSPLNDIYRSDLGEILTTYYFEEKLPEGERYVIPLKNITYRELPHKPGRGLDAIGYRKEEDGSFTLLLSETKVSDEKRNPPQVVNDTGDSIYKTQKKHHDDLPFVLQRVTDLLRKTQSGGSFAVLGCIVMLMSENQMDRVKITYGCGLVRDTTCVDKTKDFGKMQSQVDEFRPGEVDFAIFTFTEKTINEAVDLFYEKVRELTR